MSSQMRKKKDGQDKGKKMQRMRASVQERKENAAPARESRDEVDTVMYKRGSANDHNRRGAT